MKSIFNTKALMMALATLTTFSPKLPAAFDPDKNLSQQANNNKKSDLNEGNGVVGNNDHAEQLLQAAEARFKVLYPSKLINHNNKDTIDYNDKEIDKIITAIEVLMRSQLGGTAIAEPTKGQVELLIRMMKRYPSHDLNGRYREYGWIIQNGYGGRDGNEYFYVASAVDFERQNGAQIIFLLSDNWKSEDHLLEGLSNDVKARIRKTGFTYEFNTPQAQHNFPIVSNVVFKKIHIADQPGLVILEDAQVVPYGRLKK